ncbi:MAG: alpha/beta family hydrolase [Rhodanobacteraceae bacterium]
MSTEPQTLSIDVDRARRVSALLIAPDDSRACCVLAHGAGAGMTHPFMARVAAAFAAQRIATLRYQFPYMEQGSKRPDTPAIAHAAVRAACVEAARRVPGIPLLAGGKSFGGRMTSQAQAAEPLEHVRGLVLLGFPLHPAGKPSDDRAKHLFDVDVPMLFLSGTRDALADLSLLAPLAAKLGARATLETFPDADHSFHAPARSGHTDAGNIARIAELTSAWLERNVLREAQFDRMPG